MSRLECLGKSSSGPQKQMAVKVNSAHGEIHKRNDIEGKKTDTDKPRRSLPPQTRPRSVQETQKSGVPSGEVVNTDDVLETSQFFLTMSPDYSTCSPTESVNIAPRVEELMQSPVASDEKLKMKDLRKAQPSDSALTGGTTHSPPPAEPAPTHKEDRQTEEEDAGDEDIKAPVELIMEFLRAVMDRDFQLSSKLCQMILFFEPDNPEASEFLPLIQKKLLEEQEVEPRTEEEEEDEEEEEEDDDDDDSGDSGSDEKSSQSSSCSSSSRSSSSSSDDDEEEEEKQVNRHKPCPPSHIFP